MRTRVALAKFFGCSPVHLREMNGYEMRAALLLAEEIAAEADRTSRR